MENNKEKKIQWIKQTSMHKIVRNGRNGAENLSTYRALKRREKYDDIISNFQHLQQKWKVEQHKLQLDTNSKCFFLECKITLDESIVLFVLCPTAYTNSLAYVQ